MGWMCLSKCMTRKMYSLNVFLLLNPPLFAPQLSPLHTKVLKPYPAKFLSKSPQDAQEKDSEGHTSTVMGLEVKGSGWPSLCQSMCVLNVVTQGSMLPGWSRGGILGTRLAEYGWVGNAPLVSHSLLWEGTLFQGHTWVLAPNRRLALIFILSCQWHIPWLVSHDNSTSSSAVHGCWLDLATGQWWEGEGPCEVATFIKSYLPLFVADKQEIVILSAA